MDRATLKRIWDAIEWEIPKDARDISDEAGVERGRTCEAVRTGVRLLRDQGLPIVGGDEGFQKTVDPSRLVACARNLNARAAAMQNRADGLLKRVEEGWGAAAYQEVADELFKGDT